MAYEKRIRDKVRAKYVQGMALTSAAQACGVPYNTARGWKKVEAEHGNDWDIARNARRMTKSGVEEMANEVLGELATEFLATLKAVKEEEGMKPAARAQILVQLMDGYNKAISAASRAMPNPNRLAVAMDVLKFLSIFIAAEVFRSCARASSRWPRRPAKTWCASSAGDADGARAAAQGKGLSSTNYARSPRSRRRLVEAECDGFATDHAARDQRRTAGALRLRVLLPHLLPALHQERAERVSSLVQRDRAGPARQGRRAADRCLGAARRSEATLGTQLMTLWCIVTDRKHFIPLVMDSVGQAATMLEAVKVELESNPRLGDDYPDQTGAGRVWKRRRDRDAQQRQGAGLRYRQRMRGLRHGPYRH